MLCTDVQHQVGTPYHDWVHRYLGKLFSLMISSFYHLSFNRFGLLSTRKGHGRSRMGISKPANAYNMSLVYSARTKKGEKHGQPKPSNGGTCRFFHLFIYVANVRNRQVLSVKPHEFRVPIEESAVAMIHAVFARKSKKD